MRKIISGLLIAVALASPDLALARGLGIRNQPKTPVTNTFTLPREPTKKAINKGLLDGKYLSCFEKACEIEYVPDPPGNDNWQTPDETIARKKGDCEDLSFLLYDLLKKQGLKSRVVWGYMDDDERIGHIWIESVQKDTSLILDPARRAVYRKSSFLYYPRSDYIEFPKSYGCSEEIEQFIKKFEKSK